MDTSRVPVNNNEPMSDNSWLSFEDDGIGGNLELQTEVMFKPVHFQESVLEMQGHPRV